jgi:hypothetical protein
VAAAAIPLTESDVRSLDTALTADKISGPRYSPQLQSTIDR